MSTITADVLCECFALLQFSDRVIATHVCTHWRQAALSRPGALWSTIVSNGTRAGVVRQLLERAHSVPVKIDILLSDKTFEDAMTAVSDHLSHILQLRLSSLELGEGGILVENVYPIYRALAHRAPMLEEVEISLRIGDRSLDDLENQDPGEPRPMRMAFNFDRRIPTDLFSGHAPCLRKAAFLTMLLHPDGVPALAGLTQLKYTGPSLPASQLSAIVSTLPQLKALCIDARFGYDLPDTAPPSEFLLDELDLDMRAWNCCFVI